MGGTAQESPHCAFRLRRRLGRGAERLQYFRLGNRAVVGSATGLQYFRIGNGVVVRRRGAECIQYVRISNLTVIGLISRSDLLRLILVLSIAVI